MRALAAVVVERRRAHRSGSPGRSWRRSARRRGSTRRSSGRPMPAGCRSCHRSGCRGGSRFRMRSTARLERSCVVLGGGYSARASVLGLRGVAACFRRFAGPATTGQEPAPFASFGTPSWPSLAHPATRGQVRASFGAPMAVSCSPGNATGIALVESRRFDRSGARRGIPATHREPARTTCTFARGSRSARLHTSREPRVTDASGASGSIDRAAARSEDAGVSQGWCRVLPCGTDQPRHLGGVPPMSRRMRAGNCACSNGVINRRTTRC